MKIIGKFFIVVSFAISAWGLDADRAIAGIEWVDLKVEGADSVRAAFGVVKGKKSPAVIFSHGTAVRRFGHQGSIDKANMDITDYVKELNKMGYIAIAPVRSHLSDTAYVQRGGTVGSTDDWIAVIENGIQVVKAARIFLTSNANVDPNRIAIMGFSEGGNITLWSATRESGYRAVVLLSPATIRDARRYNLKQATKKSNLSSIDAPVFLAVGEDDIRPIRMITSRRLIPNLQELEKTLVFHIDYPGGHKWFYEPRDALLDDLKLFLAKHLR